MRIMDYFSKKKLMGEYKLSNWLEEKEKRKQKRSNSNYPLW